MSSVQSSPYDDAVKSLYTLRDALCQFGEPRLVATCSEFGLQLDTKLIGHDGTRTEAQMAGASIIMAVNVAASANENERNVTASDAHVTQLTATLARQTLLVEELQKQLTASAAAAAAAPLVAPPAADVARLQSRIEELEKEIKDMMIRSESKGKQPAAAPAPAPAELQEDLDNANAKLEDAKTKIVDLKARLRVSYEKRQALENSLKRYEADARDAMITEAEKAEDAEQKVDIRVERLEQDILLLQRENEELKCRVQQGNPAAAPAGAAAADITTTILTPSDLMMAVTSMGEALLSNDFLLKDMNSGEAADALLLLLPTATDARSRLPVLALLKSYLGPRKKDAFIVELCTRLRNMGIELKKEVAETLTPASMMTKLTNALAKIQSETDTLLSHQQVATMELLFKLVCSDTEMTAAMIKMALTSIANTTQAVAARHAPMPSSFNAISSNLRAFLSMLGLNEETGTLPDALMALSNADTSIVAVARHYAAHALSPVTITASKSAASKSAAGAGAAAEPDTAPATAPATKRGADDEDEKDEKRTGKKPNIAATQ